MQCLYLVAGGLTAKEIGERLGLAEGTVKNHLLRLYHTLGAHDRAHAVALACRRGLLNPEWVA